MTYYKWNKGSVNDYTIWRGESPLGPSEIIATLLVEEELSAENERLLGLFEELNQWQRAYPVTVFPEPDFEKAAELLRDGGMTIDAVSSSNMRHVLRGIGEIVARALRMDE